MKLFVATLALAALACTRTAVAFSEDVAAMLDTDVDPCNDFYQYACGSWLATHEIEPAEASISYSFDRAEDQVRESVKTLAAAASEDENSLMGTLWASCMNLEARNALGAEPLQRALTSIMEAQSKHELFVVAGQLARTGADLLVNLGPRTDLDNASESILFVSNADLTLANWYYEDPEVLTEVENDLSIYASTLLELAGFSLAGSGGGDTDYDYGEVVVNLEKQFFELQNYDVLNPDTEEDFYWSYSDAAERYPLVFGAFAQGMRLLDDSPTLNEDSEMLLASLAYLDKAEELVAMLELDVFKIYAAYTLADRFAPYLDESFMAAYFEFFGAALLGTEQTHSMEHKCVNNLIDLLPAHTGAAYVAGRQDMEATDAAFVDMAGRIREAMKHNIEMLEWLDDETRASVVNKLEAIDMMHLQPNQDQLDKETGGMLKLNATNFYANVETIELTRYMQLAEDVDQSMDRDEWEISAAEVDVYFKGRANQLVFPAGIMQAPFFGGDAQASQWFGGMGYLVGHMLTKTFGVVSSNLDGHDNYNSWWTAAMDDEFYTRTQCLADQYNALYTTDENDEQVELQFGDNDLDARVADNSGLHAAYEAYKTFMAGLQTGSGSGVSSEESDQLFFLSYAQFWCGKERGESGEENNVGETTVNGAMMNSAAFAEAFACSAVAPMNPSDKCVIW